MLRIKAIFLLTLFSFSAFGNTFEIHYCEGEVTDISLFGSANCVCENEVVFAEEEACHAEHSSCCDKSPVAEQDQNLEEKPCCESVFGQVINTIEFQHTPKSIQQAWIALLVLNPSLFLAEATEVNSELTYLDPESWVDIPIKLQRFLI
tara:strand:- start:3123 stop:3569 length:447 start_codon:yes stop_codon:yes gene_type:complete